MIRKCSIEKKAKMRRLYDVFPAGGLKTFVTTSSSSVLMLDDLALAVLNNQMVSLMEDAIGSLKLGRERGLGGREMPVHMCKASAIMCHRTHFGTSAILKGYLCDEAQLDDHDQRNS